MGQVPGGPGGTGAGAVGRQRGTGHCSPHPGRPRAFPQEPVLVHPSFLGSEVREGLCDGTDGAHGVKALSPMQGHGTESASVTGDRESGHSLGRPPLQPRDWCQPCPSQLPPGTQGGGGMAEAGGKIEARKPVQISPHFRSHCSLRLSCEVSTPNPEAASTFASAPSSSHGETAEPPLSPLPGDKTAH